MGFSPLQLALERNASIEVVAALLQAYPEAEGMQERITYPDKLAEAKRLLVSPSSSRVSATPQATRQASELVAKLKAKAPDSEVLPLITPEMAASKLHVRFLRFLTPFPTVLTEPLVCRAQFEESPLHWAASTKASKAVVAALLAAHPEAVSAPDKVYLCSIRLLRTPPRI